MVRNTVATDFEGLTYECKSCGAIVDSPSVGDLPLTGCPEGDVDTHQWVRYEGDGE